MVLERRDIDAKYKWDLSVIYKDEAAFNEDYALAEGKIKAFSKYEKTMLLYQAAMEEVLTRINILNREFKIENSYSPIEHISSRMKTP